MGFCLAALGDLLLGVVVSGRFLHYLAGFPVLYEFHLRGGAWLEDLRPFADGVIVIGAGFFLVGVELFVVVLLQREGLGVGGGREGEAELMQFSFADDHLVLLLFEGGLQVTQVSFVALQFAHLASGRRQFLSFCGQF